jgi:hypothetical protein
VTKLEGCGHVAGIIQAVATTIALGLGAWWFVEQRQTYPHGQVKQVVDVHRVGTAAIAVEAQVSFENTGKRLIHLESANIKLQDVSPEPYGYEELASQDGVAYWNAKRPVQTPDPRQFNQGELRWPLIKQFDQSIDHRVEPGETDVLVFTFLVPCSTGEGRSVRKLGVLRVASDIHKPRTEEEHGFAWKARTFVDVTAACKGKAST